MLGLAIGAAGLLTACGQGVAPSVAAGARTSGEFSGGIVPAGRTLLYISDEGNATVNEYTYPDLTLVAKLMDQGHPAGLCVDSDNAVWIVESASLRIVKYAHGAKRPAKALTDPNADNIYGCAVDPLSGDLAVADLGPPTGGGGVWVYTHAKGKPTEYRTVNLSAAYFCSYDASGNLFVDGIDKSGAFHLFRLGSSGSLQEIAFNQSVGFPGGMAWDGAHLAVGDQYYEKKHVSAIYRLAISGSTATLAGTTRLGGTCDVAQFAIGSGDVIAPDVCQNDAGLYHYPRARGGPLNDIGGLAYPLSAAISLPK
jgi:hypothetical protein